MVNKIIFLINKSNSFLCIDLKKEAFFNTMDWDNLANIPAPFIPVPDNDSDTFYFEGKIFNKIILKNFFFYYLARNRAIGFDEESVDHVSML